MTSSRLAADVVYYLSREEQDEDHRQSRVTEYFDKIKEREVVNRERRDVNDDGVIDGNNERGGDS
jgi:hypothetical protein